MGWLIGWERVVGAVRRRSSLHGMEERVRKMVGVEVGGEWRPWDWPTRLQGKAGGVWSLAGGLR